MKERNPWHTPLTIFIAVVGVIAIVALVTVAVLQNKPLIPKYKVTHHRIRQNRALSHVIMLLLHQKQTWSCYGIVLDAGSSHTAMYIYEWPAEKDNNTGRVEQTHSCKVKGPGISSYASDPKKAGQSLQVCMKEAERFVPSERHEETPLYLGATAGMRLLNIENSTASDQVFQAVSESLQKSPFSFQGARILSGQEEGAFGWVTVNYLDDRLKQVAVIDRWISQSGTHIGALDLGGASTQISFVSDAFDGSESPNNSVNFRLYGNDYNLYTHSFLCYGKDQVLRMALAHQTKSGPGSISDPCFHNGYSESKNYMTLYNSPCVSKRKPVSSPADFTHVGKGNFYQCQELVKSVFDFTQCKYTQCSFNGVYQPTLQGPFGVSITPRIITIKKQHPGIKLKYLAEYCFSGTYILTLLTEGYNFTSETFSKIRFIKQVSTAPPLAPGPPTQRTSASNVDSDKGDWFISVLVWFTFSFMCKLYRCIHLKVSHEYHCCFS
uniref:Ectonucleoside triphosphate diphosphohydrolase 1 n=1 Tax=Periophthalmus magnuspinnatus TaxID=409849 RepID=A0A3B4AY35_9GOBI